MDSPVTKLIFIAAAVAGAALVVGVMWATLGRSAPPTTTTFDLKKVQSQQLCEALGKRWNTGNTPPCGP